VDSPAARVRFGDLEVLPSYRGPGTLVCHAPEHPPGTVPVRVGLVGSGRWSDPPAYFQFLESSSLLPQIPTKKMPYELTSLSMTSDRTSPTSKSEMSESAGDLTNSLQSSLNISTESFANYFSPLPSSSLLNGDNNEMDLSAQF